MFARTLKIVSVLFPPLMALFASPAMGAQLSIRELAQHDLRVATVAFRVAVANADTCASQRMETGLVVHDLTEYAPSDRQMVSHAFSLGGGFGILGIVSGSPAMLSGLRVGDEIVGINGMRLDDWAAVQEAKQSYSRMDSFSAFMQRTLKNGTATVAFRRGPAVLATTLSGLPGCGGEASLASSSDLNAWSDGEHVVLTLGIESFARTDDELAFVISHEMAHNILGHSNRDRSAHPESAAFFGTNGIKGAESQADHFAVHLMTSAGFSAWGGVSILDHISHRLWWDFLSLDHPSFGHRIEIVESAITALSADSQRRAQIPSSFEHPAITTGKTIPIEVAAERL